MPTLLEIKFQDARLRVKEGKRHVVTGLFNSFNLTPLKQWIITFDCFF